VTENQHAVTSSILVLAPALCIPSSGYLLQGRQCAGAICNMVLAQRWLSTTVEVEQGGETTAVVKDLLEMYAL
jgi:hypothetical protein